MIYIEELKKPTSQKEQSEIGRKLLLRGLNVEYGFREMPEISFGIYGKPFFKLHPEIHFNISHCRNAVVAVISDCEVGVDVECINPFDRELAEYISSQEELDSVLKSSDPALAFTILWTKKESCCKLTGIGLQDRREIQEILKNDSSKFNTIINGMAGYVITTCTKIDVLS